MKNVINFYYLIEKYFCSDKDGNNKLYNFRKVLKIVFVTFLKKN